MRFKKLSIVFIALLMICMMCAFTIVPNIGLKSESGEKIDLSYKSVVYNGDKVSIAVEYDSYGEEFEIAKDIAVSAYDGSLKKLPLKKVSIENGKYIYEFDVLKDERINKIYIEPPVLYVPITIEKETIPVENYIDNYAKENSEKNKIVTNDYLFNVTDYKIEKITENVYHVVTYISPNSKRIPRFPELNLGDKIYSGISCLSFDESGMIVDGEFIFSIIAENESEIENDMKTAVINVQNALEMVAVDDYEISTSKTMDVIIQK